MVERVGFVKRGLLTFFEILSEDVRLKLLAFVVDDAGDARVGVGVVGVNLLIGVTLSEDVIKLFLLSVALGVDVLNTEGSGEKSSSSCRLADKNGS